MKLRQTRTISLLGFALMGAPAMAQSLEDGPYVFYKDGKIIQETVRNGQFYREALNKHAILPVQFAAHPDWNFKVKLQDKLVNEPAVFAQPAKMLVLSDIEGEFEGFRALLLANNVVDAHYNWIFGKGHLVIVGDLFDRGKEVTQYLWLLYKLEQDATAHGGYVHTLLGNHDIMNLSGDLRYVQPKYMEAAKLMGKDYMQLFGTDTELGKWLRSKNIIEKIGDRLFMHAGMAPPVNELRLSAEELNNKCRPYYATKRADVPSGLQILFGKDAPFWYRGYFMEPRASTATVDSTLALYGCTQIVVGHTILERNIALYYGGKVMAVDVNQHEGKRAAALWEKGEWYIVNDKGERKELVYSTENDVIKDQDIL